MRFQSCSKIKSILEDKLVSDIVTFLKCFTTAFFKAHSGFLFKKAKLFVVLHFVKVVFRFVLSVLFYYLAFLQLLAFQEGTSAYTAFAC